MIYYIKEEFFKNCSLDYYTSLAANYTRQTLIYRLVSQQSLDRRPSCCQDRASKRVQSLAGLRVSTASAFVPDLDVGKPSPWSDLERGRRQHPVRLPHICDAK